MNDRKAIRYLSLAAKAGRIVTGVDDCEKNVRCGKGRLMLLATDAAPNAVKRAESMAASSGVRLMRAEYTKSELAAAVGRGSTVAVALLTDKGLADAFLKAAANGMEQEERI